MTDIKIEPMSIDQLAGSFVLIFGAIGSLLLVIWQSRCECDMNLCYIIRCHRKPPPDEKLPKKKPKDSKESVDDKVNPETGESNPQFVYSDDEEEQIIPLARSRSMTPNQIP